MKRGSKLQRNPQKLASQLDQLRQLNPLELREPWQSLFGADPPSKARSSLLIQAIAYRLQEAALGGLKPATLNYSSESPTMRLHGDGCYKSLKDSRHRRDHTDP
jgi:hypothetical protein